MDVRIAHAESDAIRIERILLGILDSYPKIDWQAVCSALRLAGQVGRDLRGVWDCKGCGRCVCGRCLNHDYMVHRCVWRKAYGIKEGMLCLDCLEFRLGRPLGAVDFSGNGQVDPRKVQS